MAEIKGSFRLTIKFSMGGQIAETKKNKSVGIYWPRLISFFIFAIASAVRE